MFDIVIECSGMRTQDLAKNMLDFSPFKVWMHGRKAYARFSVDNMNSLDALTMKLIGLKISFSYVKIQTNGPTSEEG